MAIKTQAEIRRELVDIFVNVADELVQHNAAPRSEYHKDLDTEAVNRIRQMFEEQEKGYQEILTGIGDALIEEGLERAGRKINAIAHHAKNGTMHIVIEESKRLRKDEP